MSRFETSELTSFNPLAEHPFATSSPPTSSSSALTSSSASSSSSLSSYSTSKAPAASNIAIPSANPNARLGGQSIGRATSYNEHLQKSMKAPPQTFLANSYDPSPSPPTWSSVPFHAASSSPLSPSSSASSTASTNSPLASSPNGRRLNNTPSTGVFTDFRAEVERFRSSSDFDDLPVLKKKSRAYEGF